MNTPLRDPAGENATPASRVSQARRRVRVFRGEKCTTTLGSVEMSDVMTLFSKLRLGRNDCSFTMMFRDAKLGG
jgi:hypothetical protein